MTVTNDKRSTLARIFHAVGYSLFRCVDEVAGICDDSGIVQSFVGATPHTTNTDVSVIASFPVGTNLTACMFLVASIGPILGKSFQKAQCALLGHSERPKLPSDTASSVAPPTTEPL